MKNTTNLNFAIVDSDSKMSFAEETLQDFKICCISREFSLLARKEVLTGKAKFGITGDGKEVPQVALARAFKNGDWRSGYYRDQTIMLALGLAKIEDLFAQLYADSDNDPFAKGRQMTGHYTTSAIDKNGDWMSHIDQKNTSAGISSTAGQMARGLGLALASRKYRESQDLHDSTDFSKDGNEVTFVTIGDASTSEGIFWESINAACVLQVPMVVSVWDDGFGISVPKEYQTTKASISKALAGFQIEADGTGMEIYYEKAHNYPGLRSLYKEAVEKSRRTHIPSLLHIDEVTQPQGHSTSGSHERYKTQERLQWEKDFDCIKVMQEWMMKEGIATEKQIVAIKAETKKYVRECRDRAWEAFSAPTKGDRVKVLEILQRVEAQSSDKEAVGEFIKELTNLRTPLFHEIVTIAKRVKYAVLGENNDAIDDLQKFIDAAYDTADRRFHSDLYDTTEKSALRIPVVQKEFYDKPKIKNGYEILNAFFDAKLGNDPRIFAFGEDVGHIGDVNQGFAGMQEKYGEQRIFDTGIREWTIMGQAIGMAMRGLRPIAEIQYLDYLIYGLQPLVDDLATLRYRSGGKQQAPAIIRTRGHRLEGIWHSGSPMGMMIHSLRGMYMCVPRNMTQAAGMYNTLLQSNDPAIVVECLNGYRLKEEEPKNLADFTVSLGTPEVLQEGTDVTLITYGSCVRIAQKGIKMLEKKGISVELIDVQTLLPFDLESQIVESLKKTNRVVFMDEDVPGGATSYMMQEVLEKQNGYQHLDSKPVTLTAKAHRPPYGSDGDYFSKPNAEDVFETVYSLVYESEPGRFVGSL